jgi:hypothetical protein
VVGPRVRKAKRALEDNSEIQVLRIRGGSGWCPVAKVGVSGVDLEVLVPLSTLQ